MITSHYQMLTYRFRYNLAGKSVLDYSWEPSQPGPKPEEIKLLDQISGDQPFPPGYMLYDLILLRPMKQPDFKIIEPVIWRLLNPKGSLYVVSDGSIKPAFRGWKSVVWEQVGDARVEMFDKHIPNDLPFHPGMNLETAKEIANRTGRFTRTKSLSDGEKFIIWYLFDCTLYFMRLTKRLPYLIFDIGPAGAGEKPDG